LKSIVKEFEKILKGPGRVLIVSHENPDGDAVGSALALYILLKNLGKDVSVWLPGRFPEYYRWMNSSGEICFYTDNTSRLQETVKNADVLIAVDISSLSRTGRMFESLAPFEGKKVLIDHHIDPDTSGFDLVFSDVTVSSTSELVFHLLRWMDMLSCINLAMAEALYTGIMTDTGSFSFNCNSPETYEVTGHLIRCGVVADRVHKLVYDNNSENRIRLLGYSLHKLKVLPDYHTAFIALDKDELAANKSQVGDTEGIVNFALSIRGIVLAAFFSIRDGEVKISFRSKGSFSVNEFARKHFKGGGHRNAAGGSFSGSLADAVALFVSILPEYKSDLEKNDLSR
jgi:bifunctional oligoribonuclease and PAP phosphatase NrnA